MKKGGFNNRGGNKSFVHSGLQRRALSFCVVVFNLINTKS